MRILACISALAALAACGMLDVKQQQKKIDANCIIGGHVDAERRDEVPLIVVLARQTGADPMKRESWQVADHFVLEQPGPWQFAASAGTYGVIAFQDLNRDLKHQPSEPYLRIEADRIFACKAGERRSDMSLMIPAAGRSRVNEVLDIATLQARTFSQQLEISLSQVTAVGEIASLADPRFDAKVAESGLWRPFDFLFQGRPGIYFLGAYDSTKIPVLFVHGINGTPQNFKTLIERLDRRRFQPWVYYYPSGASLSQIADHLTQTMRKVQLQYRVTEFGVVAHSMGGLVSRGFLQRYRAGGGTASIPIFISISTPWDGHKGAEMGLKTAPVIVRVWVDMAPGSDYLKSLYASDTGVPHYLLFSFRQSGLSMGEGNDGVVTVASQLRPAAQENAVRVEGYNETHMGVLEAQAVSQKVNALLASRLGQKR
jgi:pimeloyl-ACP methyl ester carboxylesterase